MWLDRRYQTYRRLQDCKTLVEILASDETTKVTLLAVAALASQAAQLGKIEWGRSGKAEDALSLALPAAGRL